MKLNPYKDAPHGTTATLDLHKIMGDISAEDWHYLNQIHPFRGWQDSVIGTLVHALVQQAKQEEIGTFYEHPNNLSRFKSLLQRVAFPRIGDNQP